MVRMIKATGATLFILLLINKCQYSMGCLREARESQRFIEAKEWFRRYKSCNKQLLQGLNHQ